jgi:hypothetical protein
MMMNVLRHPNYFLIIITFRCPNSNAIITTKEFGCLIKYTIIPQVRHPKPILTANMGCNFAAPHFLLLVLIGSKMGRSNEAYTSPQLSCHKRCFFANFLQTVCAWLTSLGCGNNNIIECHSWVQPLLEYITLKTLPKCVYRQYGLRVPER